MYKNSDNYRVIKILIKIFENILFGIKKSLSLHRFSGKQLLIEMR